MATLKKIIIIWFKVECLTNYFNTFFFNNNESPKDHMIFI